MDLNEPIRSSRIESFIEGFSISDDPHWLVELNNYRTQIYTRIDSGIEPKQIVEEILEDVITNLGRLYVEIEDKVRRIIPGFIYNKFEGLVKEMMEEGLESTFRYLNREIDKRETLREKSEDY